MKKRDIRFASIPSTEEVAAERERLAYQSRYQRVLRSTIYILVVVAAAAVLLATLFLPVLQVSGDSMYPTLNDKDIILLVKSNHIAVLQLRGKRGVLRLELVLALLQRIDDLYQFSAVHPPQFTICHLCTYSQIIKNEKVFEDYEIT